MNRRRPRAVNVLADPEVQGWVSRLGIEMLPEFQKALEKSTQSGVEFKFYVVQSIGSDLNAYLGEMTAGVQHGYENAVMAMQNGVILIPESTLVKLYNKAQLATLLSYAITSVLQKHAYIAWPYAVSLSDGSRAYSNYGQPFAVWQNEQTLRIGIRQMYLAGYDIREAPFAWAVAQGKPVANPILDSKHPDQQIPWYAAYAFDYISKYYRDVDYSKLKRGEREYQQFKEELRKADPAAFADAQATSTPAAPQQAAKPHK